MEGPMEKQNDQENPCPESEVKVDSPTTSESPPSAIPGTLDTQSEPANSDISTSQISQAASVSQEVVDTQTDEDNTVTSVSQAASVPQDVIDTQSEQDNSVAPVSNVGQVPSAPQEVTHTQSEQDNSVAPVSSVGQATSAPQEVIHTQSDQDDSVAPVTSVGKNTSVPKEALHTQSDQDDSVASVTSFDQDASVPKEALHTQSDQNDSVAPVTSVGKDTSVPKEVIDTQSTVSTVAAVKQDTETFETQPGQSSVPVSPANQDTTTPQDNSTTPISPAEPISSATQISLATQVTPTAPVSPTTTSFLPVNSATQVSSDASTIPAGQTTDVKNTALDVHQSSVAHVNMDTQASSNNSTLPKMNPVEVTSQTGDKSLSTSEEETLAQPLSQTPAEIKLPGAAEGSAKDPQSQSIQPRADARGLQGATQVPKPTKIPSPISLAGTKPDKPALPGTLPANYPAMSKRQTGVTQQKEQSLPANVPKSQTAKEAPKTANVPLESKSTSKEPAVPKVSQLTPLVTAEASSATPKDVPCTSPYDQAKESPATPTPTGPEELTNQQPDKTTGQELTLYFNYSSYYSQKVLLALYEHNLTFTPRAVRLDKNEHFEPWFLAVNPKAEIPVLQIGNKYVTGSEVIINNIDRLQQSPGSVLVGDPRSSKGQVIQRFRRLIDGVNVPLITYGILYHPELSGGKLNIPPYLQEQMKDYVSRKLNVLSALSESHPSHRNSYVTLSEEHAQNYEAFHDEEAVRRELKQLDRVLGTLEEQLSSVCKESDQNNFDKWICGTAFTAADVSLLILLTRLEWLGLLTHHFEDFPLLRDYFTQGRDRSSYQRLVKEINDDKANLMPFLVYTSKKALPYVGGVTALSAAAGVAYWVYKKVT